jgi:hypothetical protein
MRDTVDTGSHFFQNAFIALNAVTDYKQPSSEPTLWFDILFPFFNILQAVRLGIFYIF